MQQRQSGQRAFSALVDWYDPLGSCVEITRPLSINSLKRCVWNLLLLLLLSRFSRVRLCATP